MIVRRQIVVRGFTLVELLVVIAIISLLASILTPSLQRANDSAKNVLCINNLRQITLGMHLYASDYNDRAPHGKWDPCVGSAAWYDIGWPGNLLQNLYPYVGKNAEIYICPKAEDDLSWDEIYAPYGKNITSYDGNQIIVNYANRGMGIDIGRVPRASKIIWLSDSGWNRCAPAWNALANSGEPTMYRPAKWADSDVMEGDGPHNTGVNTAYVDGHASSHKPGELSNGDYGLTPDDHDYSNSYTHSAAF